MVGLAAAFNARDRTGIGNTAWRRAAWWWSAFLQLRLPDDTGLRFPPQHEFWSLYAYLDPELSDLVYPIAAPGDPEGANLANVFAQFVFGNGIDPTSPYYLGPEDDRLSNIPLWVNGHAPATPGDFWALGKQQRGALDPISGLQYVPALEAAQSFFRVSTGPYSMHGKSYGGFFPTPEVSDDGEWCVDGGSNVIARNLVYFFSGQSKGLDTSKYHGTISTNSQGFPVVTYAGSCPEGTTPFNAKYLVGLGVFPFAFYCVVWTGTAYAVDVFPRADWVMGPFTGAPVLAHDAGEQLAHGIWFFTADFRGTAEERSGDRWHIEDLSIDWERFLNRQYLLAPQLGIRSGAGIVALYPQANLVGYAAAGTQLNWQREGGPNHPFRKGYVLGSAYAAAAGMSGTIAVQILADGQPFMTLTLRPDETGSAEALVVAPRDIDPGSISVRLASDALLGTSGTLRLEVTELFPYKPQFWDGCLMARLAAGMDV